jgi:DNA replication protein DnaC
MITKRKAPEVYGPESDIICEYAAPCQACRGYDQQQFEEAQKRAGIPNRYVHNVELDDFKTDVYIGMGGNEVDISRKMELVNSFVGNFYQWQEACKGFYICSGTRGSGKTFLASCITNSLMKRYCCGSRFVSASDLLEISKDEAAMDAIQKITLLVIDDIGAKTGGLDWMNDVLFKIVDARYKARKVTIYTSNVKLDKLPYDDRILDRIGDCTIELTLPEIAVRAKESNKHKHEFLKKMGLM